MKYASLEVGLLVVDYKTLETKLKYL